MPPLPAVLIEIDRRKSMERTLSFGTRTLSFDLGALKPLKVAPAIHSNGKWISVARAGYIFLQFKNIMVPYMLELTYQCQCIRVVSPLNLR